MSTFSEIKTYKKKKSGESLWLLSYADLATNLMAIFIMMLAMSTFDTQKFDAVSREVTRQRTDDLEALQRKIDAEIQKRNLQNSVTTSLGVSGLHVEFLNGVLFESANANLSAFAAEEAAPILDILSKTDSKYLLSFEGHSDDVPLRGGGKYRDNWDLSTSRGVSLLERMRLMGLPESRMNVAGYAHTRPKVDVTGKSGKELEEARAHNRRVVIRVSQ